MKKLSHPFSFTLSLFGLMMMISFSPKSGGVDGQTTYYVSTDGDDGNDGKSEMNAFATIFHAYDGASSGDTISIVAGTYPAKDNVGMEVKKNGQMDITFQANSAPGSSIIDLGDDENGTPFFFVPENGEGNFVFDGLVFQNLANGEVLKIRGGDSVVIESCSFVTIGTQNKEISNHAVLVENVKTVEIQNSIVRNNSNDGGGGTAVWLKEFSSLLISGTSFISNRGANGGALGTESQQEGSSILIQNCDFTDNFCNGDGGAWAANHSNSITIQDSRFLFNFAKDPSSSSSSFLGGSLFFDVNITLIQNTTFVGNFATGSGGALCYQRGNLTLSGSHFEFNSALENGGAIFTDVIHEPLGASFLFDNYFSTNSVGSAGGAISIHSMNEDEHSFNVSSNIFDENRADRGGAIEISCDGVMGFNQFFKNNATKGGALFLQESKSDVGSVSFKNDFSQNYATNHGGGVYVSPNAAIGHLSDIFGENTAETNGGAIYFNATTKPSQVTDCSFDLNQAEEGAHVAGSADDQNEGPFEAATFISCEFDHNQMDRSDILIENAMQFVFIESCDLPSVVQRHEGRMFVCECIFGNEGAKILTLELKNSHMFSDYHFELSDKGAKIEWSRSNISHVGSKDCSLARNVTSAPDIELKNFCEIHIEIENEGDVVYLNHVDVQNNALLRVSENATLFAATIQNFERIVVQEGGLLHSRSLIIFDDTTLHLDETSLVQGNITLNENSTLVLSYQDNPTDETLILVDGSINLEGECQIEILEQSSPLRKTTEFLGWNGFAGSFSDFNSTFEVEANYEQKYKYAEDGLYLKIQKPDNSSVPLIAWLLPTLLVVVLVGAIVGYLIYRKQEEGTISGYGSLN